MEEADGKRHTELDHILTQEIIKIATELKRSLKAERG